MSIGTPVLLGSAVSSSPVASLGATTTQASPAGNLIVAFARNTSATSNPSTVTDTAGNTYVSTGNFVGSSVGNVDIFYCQNAQALPIGGVVTLTPTSTDNVSIVVVSVSGVAASSALDVTGAGSFGSGTTPSIATGALAQAAEIIFGVDYIQSGFTDSYTEAPGFTGITNVGISSAARSAYQIVGSASSVTYAPILGTSRSYFVNVVSFKAATAINVSVSETGNAVDSPSASKGGVFNLSVAETANAVDTSNGTQPPIFAILRLLDPGPIAVFGLIDPSPIAVSARF